jgi:hypothetical protein
MTMGQVISYSGLDSVSSSQSSLHQYPMQTDNQKPVYQYSPEVLKLRDVLPGGALLVLWGGGGEFFVWGTYLFWKK